MKKYMIILGIVLFLIFVGGAFAASTFNPEKGGNNTTGFCVFLTGTSLLACTGVAWSYLNSTKASKKKQNPSTYNNTLPSAGEYAAGQAGALIQSREQISDLIRLNGNVRQVFKEEFERLKDGKSIKLPNDDIFKYIPSSREGNDINSGGSGLDTNPKEFQIRWDISHKGQEYPHLNVKGVKGAEDLNHQPLDWNPNPKTALKVYSSTEGRDVLDKVVDERKITLEDVNKLNSAAKGLSPASIGLSAVKTGLLVSIGMSVVYNSYEVYTGQKDVGTATVDVAEDTASSATGLYTTGAVFGSCMEGGWVAGPYGILGCGIAGITAGMLTDMGVRMGLEYAEHFLSSPNMGRTSCLMEMNQRKTVSMDCDGKTLLPESFPQDSNETMSQISPTMQMKQRITVSPNKTMMGDNHE